MYDTVVSLKNNNIIPADCDIKNPNPLYLRFCNQTTATKMLSASRCSHGNCAVPTLSSKNSS